MARRLSNKELVDLIVMLAKYELDLMDNHLPVMANHVAIVERDLNSELDKKVIQVNCPRCLALPNQECRGEENQRLAYFHTDRYSNFVVNDLEESN